MTWALVIGLIVVSAFAAYLWLRIKWAGADAPTKEYLRRERARQAQLDADLEKAAREKKARDDRIPTQEDWAELRERMKAATDDCEGC